jgi:plastocyanin
MTGVPFSTMNAYHTDTMTEDSLAILTSARTGPPEPQRPHLLGLIVIVLILMVVAVLLLNPGVGDVALGPSPSASDVPPSRVYTVSYRFGVFSPTNLRIRIGDTVRFRNESGGSVRFVADPSGGRSVPEFDSIGKVEPGGYFSYTFATAGVFAYHNEQDGTEAGVIIVRE